MLFYYSLAGFVSFAFLSMFSVQSLADVAVQSLANVPVQIDEIFQEVEIEPQEKKLCLVGQEVRAYPTEAECLAAQRKEEKSPSNAFDRFLDGLNLKASMRLLDVDLFDGLTFGLSYKYEVDRNRLKQNFVRLDKWRFRVGLDAGDLINDELEEEDLVFHFNLTKNSSIEFAQQFKTGPAARKFTNGYLPSKLPLTYKKALKLNPSDYVRFNANMALRAGASQVWAAQSDVNLETQLFYVLNGEFQVHFFRLDDDKIRIKIVGEHGRGPRFEAEYGLHSRFEIFGVKFIDKKIIKLTDLDDLFQFKIGRNSNDLFFVDYTLDLKNPEVQKAYDGLLSSFKKLDTLKMVAPTASQEKFKDKLIGDLEMVDHLAKEGLLYSDANNAPVVRNLKATNLSKGRSFNFSVNLMAFDLEEGAFYQENKVTRFELEKRGNEVVEVPSHYVYNANTRHSSKSFFFEKYNESIAATTFLGGISKKRCAENNES